MPDMDEFDVCRILRQDRQSCEIPIIFLSALGELKKKIKGFEAGGVD